MQRDKSKLEFDVKKILVLMGTKHNNFENME